MGFGEPRTFTWAEPDELPIGDPRLDSDPFFVARLHNAITRELAARGIRYVDGDAELLVHHHASVRDRVEVLCADHAAGYSGSPYEEVQVYQYDEGTFLVDIADRQTMRILWRGWARTDLTGSLDDREALGELVDRAIAGMFEKFPIAPGAIPAEPVPPPVLVTKERP